MTQAQWGQIIPHFIQNTLSSSKVTHLSTNWEWSPDLLDSTSWALSTSYNVFLGEASLQSSQRQGG